VVLGILSDGNTLPPLIIFKSKKKIENSLVENFKGLALIEANSNGWNNAELTEKWLTNIWKTYIPAGSYEKVLIWDKFSGHCVDAVKSTARTISKLFHIPAGCTSILQPLDTHINKSVKARFRYYFERWLQKKGQHDKTDSGQLRLPPFEDIVNWVLYSIEHVNPATILNSFDYTGKTFVNSIRRP
jgi:hypothetical protein